MKPSNVNTLKLSYPAYPEPLKYINRPPNPLFYSGSAPGEWISKPKVAIVGSRKVTSYGKSVTEDLAGKLARAGAVLISGLAYGVDAVAHQAAIEAGGVAVVVLPTPLTNIYPAGHRYLAEQILKQGGALVSEYPEGSRIYLSNFLQRNRIISGLADVVIIPEAAMRSGSLATARFGLEQGKTVMAVPGNITSPTSAGCNNLIKAGALPVCGVDDVFFALGISPAKSATANNFRGTPEEELILGLIKNGIGSQQELEFGSRLSGSDINSALTMLEISGVIKAKGAGNWTAT